MVRLTFLIIIGIYTFSVPLLAQTQKNLEHLKTFARLYGYVRYFHPSNEAVEVDWEQMAIYGAHQARQAADKEALHQNLQALFAPVAPTLIIYPAAVSAEFIPDPLIPPDTSNYRTVAWQHLGVHLGRQSNIYKSRRTGQSEKKPSPTFGTLGNSMEITQYQGNDVKLVASVKMAAEAEGSGHLWLREERGAQPGFALNMEDHPITDTVWQTYEVIGTLAPDATSLGFGCSLRGEGKLWVDGFQLYTKNPRAKSWKLIPLPNADFEEDAPNRPPKNWFAESRKYAFLVTDSVADQGSQSVQIFTESPSRHGLLFPQYPKVGEVYQQEIGSGLASIVPLALYGNDEHTYPPKEEDAFNAFIKMLDNQMPDMISGANLDVRLGSIIIAWNVFQHFYPYFDVVAVDWDGALEEAFRDAYQDSSSTDFLQTLRVLIAKLEDGHGQVYLAGDRSETYFPSVMWEWIEDSLVITDTGQEGLYVGDVVTSIQGQSPKMYFDSLYETISFPSLGWRDYQARASSLWGSYQSTLTLGINSSSKIVLTRDVQAQYYYPHLLNGGRDTSLQELEKGIYYVNVSVASMNDIEKEIEVLQKAKSIIFDLRGYPNRNHEIISHLLTSPDTSTAWMQVPQIIYPDQQNMVGYENDGWAMKPHEPSLDAKIIFITDGRAISYAESFMSFIEHYDLATIVGQPTAGTNGNVNAITLPGGYHIYWTGMKVRKHDGSQHHGVGILPDVYVEKTMAGVRAGRDEFLEKALEIARLE
ncbi:MAG: S41 family peptidase [Cyclobacteriaceae bacterium]